MNKLQVNSGFSFFTQQKRIFLLVVFCLFIFNQIILFADEREEIIIEASLPVFQVLSIEEMKSFPQISDNDYSNGYIELEDAATLMVSSNIPWKIIIFSNQFNLYKSQGKFKSIDNFQCRVGSDAYCSISNEELTLMEGDGGIKDQEISIDYRMKISWIDTPPGTWEINPEFRIKPSETSKGNYQQYTESSLFSSRNGVIFPAITSEDLDRGYINSVKSIRMSDLFHINSDRRYAAGGYITSAEAYFAPYEKRKSHRDLLWKLDCESESMFRSIDFDLAEIYFADSWQNTALDFRLMLDWEDMPGNYSIEGIVIIETERIKEKIIDNIKSNKSAFK